FVVLLTPTCPPSSTLFPYTTLFRSILCRDAAVLEPALRRARHAQAEFSIDVLCTKPGSILFHNESAHVAVVVLRPNNFHVGDGRDRKSTRLNSSHLGISYAVFCLKK